jgi:hypothetical protein
MSNMHFVKLLCIKQYNVDPDVVTGSMTDEVNLPTESIEFNSGGQICKVVVPYYQDKQQMFCTTNHELNSVQSGRFTIYLQQPLVNSGTTSSEVRFNLFYSLEDFEFFGFNTSTYTLTSAYTTGDDVDSNITPPAVTMKAESSFTPYNVSSQADLETVKVLEPNSKVYDMRPIESVREYTRRYQPYRTLLPYNEFAISILTNVNRLSHQYNAFLGGLKIKIEFPLDSPIHRIGYFPPNLNLRADGQVFSTYTLSLDASVSTSHAITTGTAKVFEFLVVPYTPFKFTRLSHSSPDSVDASNGYLAAFDIDGTQLPFPLGTTIWSAHTDDARMGFHTRVLDIQDRKLPEQVSVSSSLLRRYFYST